MDKFLLKHYFIKKPKISNIIIGGPYSNGIGLGIGNTVHDNHRGYYSNSIGIDGRGNTIRGHIHNDYIHIGNDLRRNIEEFTTTSLLTNDLCTVFTREEATAHIKRRMMEEVFENMVRSGMFEFHSTVDPTTFGERINCRLKVVRPQN